MFPRRRWSVAITSTMMSTMLIMMMIFITTYGQGTCPPGGCGPFGNCIKDTRSCGNQCDYSCKCDPGFFGDDCSYQVEVCPGAVEPNGEQECYNGGHCQVVESTVGQFTTELWQCDCREAMGPTGTIYAGRQCEYNSQVSCEIGKANSTYAFCTNGGTCTKMVVSGEPHVPCKCPSQFVGRHCQFQAGSAPANEIIYEASQNHSNRMSGVGIFFIVLVVLIFVAGSIFFAMKHLRKKQCEKEAAAEDTSDLDLVENATDKEEDNEII